MRLSRLDRARQFSLIIGSEIHQLQDIFDGALLADPAAWPGGTVKDQILLLRLDWNREYAIQLRSSFFAAINKGCQ